jgi:hypothetical protein
MVNLWEGNMAKLLISISLVTFFSGCATTKVYVDRSKTYSQTENDKKECQGENYDDCMAKKGYKLIDQNDADKVRGFKNGSFNSRVDLKKYTVVFIDNVDTSEVKLKEPDSLENILVNKTKPDSSEAVMVASKMRTKFKEMLSKVIPSVDDQNDISGKKALVINLKLKEIVGADAEANIVTNILIRTSVANTKLTMECTISDASTGEKIAVFSDSHQPSMMDSNASVVIGTQNYTRWQGAYNTIDLWADDLAAFLAEKRGQKYKSLLNRTI